MEIRVVTEYEEKYAAECEEKGDLFFVDFENNFLYYPRANEIVKPKDNMLPDDDDLLKNTKKLL